MATTNKITLADNLRMLESGMKADLTDVQTIVLGGTTYTLAEAINKVASFIAVQDAATKAKNDWHTAVATEKASAKNARTYRGQLKGYLVARYGKDSPKLSEFGFKPSLPKKPTTKTKAKALVQTIATRAARHTMGSKQKAKIKGVVAPDPVPAPAPQPVVATAVSGGASGS